MGAGALRSTGAIAPAPTLRELRERARLARHVRDHLEAEHARAARRAEDLRAQVEDARTADEDADRAYRAELARLEAIGYL